MLPTGATGVDAPVQGTVWKLEAAAGDLVEQSQTLLILEAMKMEMRVLAPVTGRLTELLCQQGRSVANGQRIAVITLETTP